ncbi:MAG: family 1 glycosylhydrolase [Acidobacteria bacterium]|nr:family 1 glycosylhydrolase [Acidobacteriota bacterium]
MFKQQPKLAVGYECTPICDAEKLFGEPKDVLDATRHYERFEHDFDLQEELGIYELRYPAGWDKVLISPFRYNFERIAPIMESMRRRGFVPTIDLCHHKAPKQIRDGFANPEFVEHLLDFALEFQKAFPWIKRYTVINEPAVTALFHSTEVGLWAQHDWSNVFLNMAEAISTVSRALKRRNPRIKFFQPEPIDHDAVADRADTEIVAHVEFLRRHGRFGMDNLLGGKVDDAHPFFERLIAKGAKAERIAWFQKNPSEPYQKDLDFYAHCFKVWYRDRRGRMTHKNNPNPPSLVSVINDYRAHLPAGMRLGIGETNVRGAVRDRITFFKWVLEQCAEAGIGKISWWGLTDADMWGEGNLTRWWREGKPDPVGIFMLSDCAVQGRLWKREANEFSEIFKAYARGQISIDDIPVYKFSGELKTVLNGFSKNHMQHWRKKK